MTKPASIYLRREQKIAKGEQDGIVERWRYGRDLIKDKAGKKKLPTGKIEYLINEAAQAGIKISEREIQRRIKCAEVYASEAQLRRSSDGIGSWTALHEAGFPTVDIDVSELGPDDLDDAGITTTAPDEWQQPTLIPGAPESGVLKIRKRSVPLADATIGDFKAYCEQSTEMTENFIKRDTVLWASYRAMREVTDDMDANAVEAYQRAIGGAA